jgi:hypothetical protein
MPIPSETLPKTSTGPARARKAPLSLRPLFVCSRAWQPGLTFYVRERPGEGGADWGYTDEPAKARPITRYWARRFAKDMERVGAVGVNCCPAYVDHVTDE